MKAMIPALMLATALASIQPAGACHRFHSWRYPWPQRCNTNAPDFAPGVRDRRPLSRDIPSAVPLVAEDDDREWYVEITKAPPVPPLEDDQRTPEQIKDFDEHYIELARHRDEINALMTILHAQEDAARAAGLKQ